MSLLFDQNISFRITRLLKDVYPECKHVSECGLLDCEDQEIWEYSLSNNLSIVTFDSDFYDMSVVQGHPPKIVWIRSGNSTTKAIAARMKQHKIIIDKFLYADDFKNISCLEID